MKTSRNPRYWLEKRAHRRTGYRLATVAYYGPDDRRASKVVVAIFPREGDEARADLMSKWFSNDTDVRVDASINEQILAFLHEHDVARVGMMDRIIGCPHEEGIDYPAGEVCPQCQFWAGRERSTGERMH